MLNFQVVLLYYHLCYFLFWYKTTTNLGHDIAFVPKNMTVLRKDIWASVQMMTKIQIHLMMHSHRNVKISSALNWLRPSDKGKTKKTSKEKGQNFGFLK